MAPDARCSRLRRRPEGNGTGRVVDSAGPARIPSFRAEPENHPSAAAMGWALWEIFRSSQPVSLRAHGAHRSADSAARPRHLTDCRATENENNAPTPVGTFSPPAR